MSGGRRLPRIHRRSNDTDHWRTRLRVRNDREAGIAHVDDRAIAVRDQPERLNRGRWVKIGMAADDQRGDTASGHEMAFIERCGYLGLELVRRVAIAVSNDDFVIGKEDRHPAAGQLDPFMLKDLDYPRQHQVAGFGRNILDEALHPGTVCQPRRIRRLRCLNTFH